MCCQANILIMGSKIKCFKPAYLPFCHHLNCIFTLQICISGPISVVDIATGCGLEGPGIESRCGRDFLHLSRPALGPTQLPVQWVQGLSQG